MNIYIESVYVAVIAFVYSCMLTESGMIFNKPYVLAEKYLPAWLFNPIIGCMYCVAGQIALWYYLIAFWFEYSFIDHVLFISAAILGVKIINSLITYIDEKD